MHLDEVDVSSTGFAQARYLVDQDDSLRLYNPSDDAVTVCIGQHATCTNIDGGPDRLRGPGLRLEPGESRLINFAAASVLPLTVIDPAPNARFPDTSVTVQAPSDRDSGPF